jgi:hypothetical protein
MGAWGSDSFENDAAADWLADLCDAPNIELISDALVTVAGMNNTEYIEVPECSVNCCG